MGGRGVELCVDERQPYFKAAPQTGRADDVDAAAHGLNEVGADRQAEAGAAETAGGGAVGLFEGLEQAGDFVRTHADAGVADPQLQHVALDAGIQGDRSVFGELDRVAEQVDEHLRDAQRIAQAAGRQAVFAHFEAQPAFEGALGGEGDDVVDDLFRLDGDVFDR